MLRRCWDALRRNAFALSVVGSAYAVAYISTVQLRPLFAPDTRYYAGMALWFGGVDQESAADRVAAYSAKSGWESPAADVLFGWGLVQPRVVYPALSVPFVKLFGIPGLAVIPGVAMALLVLVLLLMLGRRYGNVAATGTLLLVCASPTLLFYGSAMLTESLTALLGALLLAVAWRWVREPTTAGVVAMVVLTVLSGFTRQATLIPAGAFVMAWVCAAMLRTRPNPWRIPALAVGVSAVSVQLLQMWLFPGFSQLNQFKAKTGADTLAEAILRAPELAWNILEVDVARLASTDRALLIFLGLGLVSMVVFWRRTESHMLLGALLAYELYNVTNGTPTAFRYGMPGLVFFAVAVTVLVSELTERSRRQPAPAGRHTGPVDSLLA